MPSSIELEALESQLDVLFRIQESRAGEHIILCKECYLTPEDHSFDITHPVAHFLPIGHIIAEIQNEIDCNKLLSGYQ